MKVGGDSGCGGWDGMGTAGAKAKGQRQDGSLLVVGCSKLALSH